MFNQRQPLIEDLNTIAHIYARLIEAAKEPTGLKIYTTLRNLESCMEMLSEDIYDDIELGGYISEEEDDEFDGLDTEEPKYISYTEAMLMAKDDILVTRAMWVSEDKLCGIKGDTQFCVERKNVCCANPESCKCGAPLKGVINSSITYIPTQEDMSARDWYVLTEIPWD